jgi:hypothetical protein
VSTQSLPTRIEKQIAGRCCYGGCHDPAKDGSDYCEPHDAHERGRDAAKKRRRRQRLADSGRCIAGCGRKVGKRRRPDGSIALRECRQCSKATKARHARPVPGAGLPVPGDAIDIDWRVDPGTNWLRYRGKGRRGRLTNAEQADEDRRDARFAIADIEKFIAAIDVVMSEAVQALGAEQRKAAKRQAAQHLGSARRFLEDLEERYGA